METPDRNRIYERATELWRTDRIRNGQPFDINPELSELQEEGFLGLAQQELMRSEDVEYKLYIEKEARELGLLKNGMENLKKEKTKLEETSAIFDVDLALDSGFFVSGTSQVGKTTLVKHLVKMLLDHGITVYVLDVSQAWNKDSPIANSLFVSKDVKNYYWKDSTVFDLSVLTTRDRIAFADLLCKVVLEKHVQGYAMKEFIVFEEAQTYMPNGCLRLAVRRASPCENVLNLVTVGANYSVRFGLITQFPAMIDKALVKITQQRYFGWTWEKNDVAYLRGFLGKTYEKLKSLGKGEFIYMNKDNIRQIKTEIFGNRKIAMPIQFNYSWSLCPFLSTETFI